ncbi:lebercilin-like isoform X2 [Acipenser ruthenus]|nr:lebercilin-like isoform X2 [Acipenser ruthenus]XP_058880135.1 lebercilin-like isoform X2 [Acipenser ruthenus]
MPKDLDLVTKRMLSARLLKINELKNEMSEQQLRLEELQKENKALRLLQHRQEKALNKFEDTESEIAQLISSHNNELRTLRERLRKSQEKERTTERRLKDSEEELYRTKSSLLKLRKLAEDKQLAERDVLARKLSLADTRLEDNDRRIKDLEKNLELSNSSFQRQLAAEKKKAHEAQEEVKNMRDELERLNHKLKEKEKELDSKNIYANRMLKPSPKKDTDITPRKKAPNHNTTKGVQTDENLLAIEFPPPPPAITDGTIYPEEDDYFSLKDMSHQAIQGRATVSGPSVRKTPQRKIIKEQDNKEQEEREAAERLRVAKERQEREKEREEKLRRDQEQHALEEKARRLREEWEREEMERKRREKELYQQQDERERKLKDQDQQSLEEERRKKDLLLARMREVDLEAQGPDIFSDFSSTKPATHSQPNQTPNILKFSESVNNLNNGVPTHRSSDSIKKPDSSGRRAIKTVDSSEDLTFGSYAPSFGKTSGRTGLSSKKSESPEEKDKDNIDTAFGNNKKSNLMQQLFGASANAEISTLEILHLPAANKTSQNKGGALPWEKSSPAKKKDNYPFFNEGKTVSSNKGRPHIAADRPAVRAISSLEDELEEVVL